MSAGTLFQYSGGEATIANDFTVTSGTNIIQNTGGGLLTLGGNLTNQGSVLQFSGGSYDVMGSITGSGGSTILSNAAVTLSTAANYTGSTYLVAGSTLTAGAGVEYALPATTSLTLGGAGDSVSSTNTFSLIGMDVTLAQLNSTGLGVNQIIAQDAFSTATLTITGDSTFHGSIGGSNADTQRMNLAVVGGNVNLTGNNTYTGTTTISGGQLALTGSGMLSGTTSVTVNSGATLLLGVGYGVTDAVNNAADLTLAGGTLAMGGTGGADTRTASQTFNSLTLTANSVIDFSSLIGNSSLTFGSIAQGGFTLSIWNYVSGTTSLYDNNGTGLDLTKISFYSGEGSGLLGTASFSGNQLVPDLVPIPEPGVVIAGCLLLGWLLISKASCGMLFTLIRRRLG
jgi:autotransporter-associated beta strand protein